MHITRSVVPLCLAAVVAGAVVHAQFARPARLKRQIWTTMSLNIEPRRR